MKYTTFLHLALTLAVVGALYLIIREGRRLLDMGLGENPLGLVGDDENPGDLTEYYMWKSNNPEADLFGIVEQGSIWDWNPFALGGGTRRYGIFG